MDLNKTYSWGNLSTTTWNLASTGLQIGSLLYGYYEQRKAAKAYNKALQANYRTQLGAMEAKNNQLVNQAASQQSVLARQAAAERSSIVTALGESGASGNVQQRLLATNRIRETDATQQIANNLNNQFAQNYREAEGMRSQAQANVKSGPSLLGLGLQIGSSALDAFNPNETARRPYAGRVG